MCFVTGEEYFVVSNVPEDWVCVWHWWWWPLIALVCSDRALITTDHMTQEPAVAAEQERTNIMHTTVTRTCHQHALPLVSTNQFCALIGWLPDRHALMIQFPRSVQQWSQRPEQQCWPLTTQTLVSMSTWLGKSGHLSRTLFTIPTIIKLTTIISQPPGYTFNESKPD